jgi:hypothetical protein
MEQEEDESITFKKSERMTYGAVNYDGNELMAMISGYDLRIAFNMRVINSLADAEACADALADVFYEALMEQLIAEKSDFLTPPSGPGAILNEREE